MKTPMRKKIIIHTVLSICTFIMLGPFLWAVLGSFKTYIDITAFPPKILFLPTIDNYVEVFSGGFSIHYTNSLIVTLASLAISLAVGVPAAYGFARFNFRHRSDLMFWILSTRMAPLLGVLIPFFLFFMQIGLRDTLLALIIIYPVINIPIIIWMMRDFFLKVPYELEDSARVDGCSRLQVLVRISLPLVAPGLAASAIVCAIFTWNEFMFALTLLQSPSNKTVPLSLYGFIGQYVIRYEYLCAASVAATMPILVLAILARNYLVKGLTLAAVKE